MPLDGKFSWLRTQDGVRLRAAFWPGRKLRGTVLILQGRTECIEKYYETIDELRTRGFAAAAFDWRGQGLSDRALPDRHRGHVLDFAEYHQDMDCFLDGFVARTAELPKPYLILAHSMGAHMALRYLHDRPGPFARAVLCSPMVSINTAPLPHFVARSIACLGVKCGLADSYVPGGQVYDPARNRFEDNPLTHDKARFAREAELFRGNPDLAISSPTLGWLDAAYRSMKMVQEPLYCASIRTPALVLYGSEETICSPLLQARLAEALGAGRAERIPGARHEILQETDAIRARFWRAFDGFVD
ncbi:MAG: alpha/beta fold hydrolase [Pseudomonadota bacterium]|jgi:lysophospholipase|nr:alpha/beta hydrolase [Alphaproteobacteria bacterium]